MRGTWLVRGGIILLLAALAALYVDKAALLAQFDRRLLIAALVVQPLVFLWLFLTAWRHGLIVARPPARLGYTLPAVTLSVGLNAILPARASEALKATYLAQHAGLSISRCIGAVFLERLADLVIVGLMGWGAIITLNIDLTPQIVALAIGLPIALVVLMALAGKFIVRRPIASKARLLRSIAETLGTVSDQMHPWGLSRLFGLGAVIWGTGFLILAGFLACASSHSLSGVQMLTVFVITTVGSAIPALPGGVGTYQAAGTLILTKYGFSVEEALALTTALQVTMYLFLLPLALVISVRDGTGLRGLWRKARELQGLRT